MPPRKKKPSAAGKGGSAAGGGGGVLGSLGGKKNKGKSKVKEVYKVVGGLVPTLGWLWKDGQPIPKYPPKDGKDKAADDDEKVAEEKEEPVRRLPAFLVLNLTSPGQGSEFEPTAERDNHAVLDASAQLRVGEFRMRLRDFLGDWQSLVRPEPANDAKGGKSQPKTKKPKPKGKKGKKGGIGGGGGGDDDEPVKLKPPPPQRLVSGRRVWSDATRLGAIVLEAGTGGGGSSGEFGLPAHLLPWAKHGIELMRYGPIVIVLGTAALVESSQFPPPQQQSAGVLDAAAAAPANAAAPGGSLSQGQPRPQPRLPVVRTAAAWGGASGHSHVTSERPVRLLADALDPRTGNPHLRQEAGRAQQARTGGGKRRGRVPPEAEDYTARAPLGFISAAVAIDRPARFPAIDR